MQIPSDSSYPSACVYFMVAFGCLPEAGNVFKRFVCRLYFLEYCISCTILRRLTWYCVVFLMNSFVLCCIFDVLYFIVFCFALLNRLCMFGIMYCIIYGLNIYEESYRNANELYFMIQKLLHVDYTTLLREQHCIGDYFCFITCIGDILD